MKWPPKRGASVWSPDGREFIVQSVGERTAVLVAKVGGFRTTAGREWLETEWSDTAPTGAEGVER